MNPRRRYSNYFLTALLAGTLLVYGELPLANAQSAQSSSGQSSSEGQNGSNSLPEAPSPQSAQAQQSTQTPSGAAGAPGANPKGAPGAQPVGAAVAPAKQHGHRSLLIKVGLIAGGAVAIGTVVALSERSPTRPPGTTASSR
jgi:hypothetical protein